MLNGIIARRRYIATSSIIAALICGLFGYWFAGRQIAALDANALHPPLWLMFNTGVRIALTAFIAFAICQAYVCSTPSFPFWSPLLGLIPLVGIFAGLPITWALRSGVTCLLLTAAICFLWRSARAKDHAAARHWVSLLIIIVIQIIFNGYFTPLALKMTPFHIPGVCNPQIAAASPLFHQFFWIKQFSLSFLGPEYWGIAPNTPVSFESPALQLMALLADSASADVMNFYRMLHWLFFILCVAGSFGFYLMLHAGLKIRWALSTAGGMLYIFAQTPFFSSVIERDHIVSISTIAALPFAICAIFCALRKNSMFLAALAGASLASVFFLLAPHPEPLMEMLLCYSTLAIAAAFGENALPWKRRIMLMGCSGVWFVFLSIFHIGPLLLLQATGGLYTQGHSELSTLGLFGLMGAGISFIVVPHLLAAGKSGHVLYGHLHGTSALKIPMAALGLVVLLAPVRSPLLVVVGTWLHMLPDFDIRAYGRRGFIIAFCTLMLIIYAFEKADIINSLEKKVEFFFTIKRHRGAVGGGCVILAAALLCWPIDLTPSEQPLNPHRCPYYIMLDTLLANYPLLKGDPANNALIRSRLLDFENDLHQRHAEDYHFGYRTILTDYHVNTVAEITEDKLYAFARSSALLVDRFYLDDKFHCVNPTNGRYDNGRKYTLLPNLASLYSGMPTPFMTIAAFTGNERLPHLVSSNETGSLLFGAGQGLFMHNSGSGFDARFMVAAPLMQALYLHPGYHFAALGNYNDNRNWYLEPQLLQNPLYRKVFDIAGFDIIIAPSRQSEALSGVPDFRRVTESYHSPLSSLADLVTLYNSRSYGMAYLANHIYSVDSDSIARLEKILRGELISPSTSTVFKDTTDRLYSELNKLHDYRDIVLERPAPLMDETAPPGNVVIRDILGEAAVMRADCKREECEFVYNRAKTPGWYAYVDGKSLPIARANFAFMAITILKGEHEIWFAYAPFSDLCFSLLSLLGFAALPFSYRRHTGV